MDKLRSVALILKGVVEEGIAHADLALAVPVHLVAQLLEPHPVIGVLGLRDLVG